MTGPVSTDALGVTQMHEHIILDVYPTRWGYGSVLDDIEVSIQEVQLYKEAGGTTLVEQTMRGGGRDPLGLKRISEESGVHIVMATAFAWAQFKNPVASLVNSTPPSQLADILVRDIEEGVDDTGVRAGFIGEVGAGGSRMSEGVNFISPLEERLFRAAARAHRQTGLMVYTHTYQGELALEEVKLLEEEAVNLEKVVIGHLGDRNCVDYYEEIARTGVCLGIDHIGQSYGMQVYAPDTRRVDNIVALIERGYLKQLVLSQDLFLKEMWHYNNGVGYDHILHSFLPMLLERGVSDAEIRTMLVDNPARLLAV
ncbi:MAG: hypothetical protein VX733_15185 [Candidatus Latescibacterota bacterium]|nr:hypothetical protein [Candidatus Latescibacterota bacterium]